MLAMAQAVCQRPT